MQEKGRAQRTVRGKVPRKGGGATKRLVLFLRMPSQAEYSNVSHDGGDASDYRGYPKIDQLSFRIGKNNST